MNNENIHDLEVRIGVLKNVVKEKGERSGLKDTPEKLEIKAERLFEFLNDQKLLRYIDKVKGPEAVIKLHEGKRMDYASLNEAVYLNVARTGDENKPLYKPLVFAVCNVNFVGSEYKKLLGDNLNAKTILPYAKRRLRGYHIGNIDQLEDGGFSVNGFRGINAHSFSQAHGDFVEKTVDNILKEINGIPVTIRPS